MGKEDDGFMSNEKLFNMLTDLTREVNEYNRTVTKQISELHIEMKKYNNMRDRVEEDRRQIEEIEKLALTNKVKINSIVCEEEGGLKQREKIAWVVAVIASLVTILRFMGVL